MSFNFYMPVRVIGGKDVIKKHYDEFEKYGKKCLIVCGGSSAKKSGALSDTQAALKKCGIQYCIYDKITQNPKTSDCLNAGKAAREFSADFIIGIGGGSQLDAAKAVAVYAVDEKLKADDIYTCHVKKPLPVILTGTTAGTGSEVTGVSVLTKENGKKKSVSGENYYAKLAFCDPVYTYSVPYDFTVSTAIDAFSHAVESLFSNKADSSSRYYAWRSLKPIWNSLEFFRTNRAIPTDKMRDELYYCSIYAGMALNATGTCFPHAMGYTLTEDYGIPHGFACAVFLPAFVKRAMEFKSELAMQFLSEIGVSYPEFEKTVFSLVDTANIKMTSKQISAYCENWHGIKNFDNSPGGYTVTEAEELLNDLFNK